MTTTPTKTLVIPADEWTPEDATEVLRLIRQAQADVQDRAGRTTSPQAWYAAVTGFVAFGAMLASLALALANKHQGDQQDVNTAFATAAVAFLVAIGASAVYRRHNPRH
jgi:uncharacterized membrane protein